MTLIVDVEAAAVAAAVVAAAAAASFHVIGIGERDWICPPCNLPDGRLDFCSTRTLKEASIFLNNVTYETDSVGSLISSYLDKYWFSKKL